MRAPRPGGMPSAQSLGVNDTLFRFLVTIFERVGSTDDQPHDDHVVARNTDATLQELETKIEELGANQAALSESVQAGLEQAQAKIEGIQSAQGVFAETVRADLEELGGTLLDAQSRLEDFDALDQAGLREFVDEISETLASLNSLGEQIQDNLEEQVASIRDDVDSTQSLLGALSGVATPEAIEELSGTLTTNSVNAGLIVFDGSKFRNRDLNGGNGISVTNPKGNSGNPSVDVDFNLSALGTIPTIVGSGVDSDINTALENLETAVTAIISALNN